MPRSRRSRKAGWWPGQHHGCSSGRQTGRLTFSLRTITAVLLLATQFPVKGQSLLHIRVVEGEGAIHGAGTKSPRGVVVEITDETGKPVNGAAVSFRLPEEGPGGTFARGMRTEIAITTPDGRAGVHEILTSRIPGPFQIRVTAVRDSIRAGTVVDQYISEGPVKSAGKSARSLTSGSGGKSSRSWVMWLAIAGGAAAAGVAAGTMRGKGSSPGSTTPAPGPAPTLGTPTISIGRPQ